MNFCVAILILKMEKKATFSVYYALLFQRKGKLTEMQKRICAVFGEGAVIDRMCQKWFVKYCAGTFSMYSAVQLGRPVKVDSNQIETLIENNQCYTM